MSAVAGFYHSTLNIPFQRKQISEFPSSHEQRVQEARDKAETEKQRLQEQSRLYQLSVDNIYYQDRLPDIEAALNTEFKDYRSECSYGNPIIISRGYDILQRFQDPSYGFSQRQQTLELGYGPRKWNFKRHKESPFDPEYRHILERAFAPLPFDQLKPLLEEFISLGLVEAYSSSHPGTQKGHAYCAHHARFTHETHWTLRLTNNGRRALKDFNPNKKP